MKLQYSEKDIPAYFSFAKQFTLCDNYFTEVATESEPNHPMLVRAASQIIDNAGRDRTYQPQEPFKFPVQDFGKIESWNRRSPGRISRRWAIWN